MSDESPPLVATHEGVVRVTEDVQLPCAVLEDGTRVLTQREFVRALGRRGNVKIGQVERSVEEDGETKVFKLPVFLGADNLGPFISKGLRESSTPVYFLTTRGKRSRGYRAELLPEICNVFLDAREAGRLQKNQTHIAERCRLLLRAYASVGIVALVDEATGYQEVRARRALEEILQRFLSDHKARWAKTFPDEFYTEIFRLRGWAYTESSFQRRPAVVGLYTNDIVYERLAPGVLARLEQVNPKNDKGRRSARHHQWLTQDHGVPELKTHMAGVLALMRASKSWPGFISILNRAFPVVGTQFDLELDTD